MGELVGPGALTQYGGARRRRARGTCVVREPACGFFMAGSSIDEMNGVYGRVARVPAALQHQALLAYKHDQSGWLMVLVDRNEDGADDDLNREWLLVDDRLADRFSHEGDTIIPGAGVRWSKVGGGVQDDDELPWQVIALLDAGVLRDLRASYIYRQRKIAAAIAGKGLPKPQGECGGGRWVWRVEAEDVAIRDRPSDSGVWCGQRAKGSTLRGTEQRSGWVRLCDSERMREQDYLERYVSFLGKVKGDRVASAADVPELWTKATAADGSALLSRVRCEDAPCLRAAPDDPALEMPAFDRPFEPRIGGPSQEPEQEPDEDGEEPAPDSDGGEPAAPAWQAEDEDGPLHDELRLLGLSAAALGMDGGHVAEAEAEERLAAALRAAQRDLGADVQRQRMALAAHAALRRASKQRSASPRSAAANTVLPAERHLDCSPPRLSRTGGLRAAPHRAVEAGNLGERAASAARSAGSNDSLRVVQQGVAGLRGLVQDEARRVRELGEEEGSDGVRLRATLVRALLRGRQDDDALREAEAAAQLHPRAATTLLWRARCLLRAGRRAEGMEELERAVEVGPSAGADAGWAHREAAARLRRSRRAQRLKGQADDAYGCGRFAEAARLYGDALTAADADDKWGRASMYANRAACLRRARCLPQALLDCDAALRLFPSYRRALLRKAVCLLELGQPKEAVAGFETLLRCDRDWPDLLDWLVRAHAQLKRQEKHDHDNDDDAAASDSLAGKIASGGVDHYSALGVARDASAEQLKHAYRITSLKYHPDRPGGSTQLFQRIAQAYDVLSDPQKRQLYDDGGDLKKDDSDSDDERQRSLREDVERRYFPERYKFWPFGDPFIQKRKHDERKRKSGGRQAKPTWWGAPTR